MGEIQLQRQCIKAAAQVGIWCYLVRAEKGRGRGEPAVEPGTPDIDAPGLGRVEMKLPSETLSAVQREWHRKAIAQGERVATCYSVGECVRTLLEWRREKAAGQRRCPIERCPLEEQ